LLLFFLFRRAISLTKAIGWSFIANLATTLLGFILLPGFWFISVLAILLVTPGADKSLLMQTIYKVNIWATGDADSSATWQLGQFIIILILCYISSALIEGIILFRLQRTLSNRSASNVLRISFITNFISYIGMAAIFYYAITAGTFKGG